MSINPRERLTLHRARALTRLPPSQKYLPSIVTGRTVPVILDFVCAEMQSYMARNRSRWLKLKTLVVFEAQRMRLSIPGYV